MNSALKEPEETVYRFEMLEESKSIAKGKPKPVMDEANELMAVLVTSIKTA